VAKDGTSTYGLLGKHPTTGGFVSPAVIDSMYNILVGHGRITAAREEGYKTVPCVFAESLTDAKKRAYILADNQLIRKNPLRRSMARLP